jgi:pyrimidine-nucleoside phosphorylase
MMSGRGLGHTGGTLDKLESIPGFRVGLSLEEFRAALRKVGCALIGQTAEIAPADKMLYALRDVTATVESIPLISASIMSKKIAEGIDALVLDVKCGRGAFMKTREDARQLAKSLVAVGMANGVRTQAVITAMDHVLGRTVGNAVEVIECLETLKGKGPADLESLSVLLAAQMLCQGGVAASYIEAERKVREALNSGRGLEKLRAIIETQGGDPHVCDDYSRLPAAPRQHLVRVEHSGHVTGIHAELLGRATMVLGAGRDRKEDPVDPAVGAVVRAPVGAAVKAGDVLVELHYREEARLEPALRLIGRAWEIGEGPPPRESLVLETVG